MSASSHTWQAAGQPAHPYKEEAISSRCATCGDSLAVGVPLADIETPTMANHADYFCYGTKHVCRACAWFFTIGKGRPGNFLACGDRLEYLVISLESVVADKRPWLTALSELAGLPPETLVTGVMTTDVKPRLWPRARLATVGSFGLYVHAPDYDVSGWREFELSACIATIEVMRGPLRAGYAKTSLYHGLFRDYARACRDPAQAAEWDKHLARHRQAAHFLPALIAAGTTQEEKKDVKLTAAKPDGNLEPAADGGNQPAEAQLGLF